MNMKLIRLFFLCVFSLISLLVSGQVKEKDVFRAEFGALGGGSFYLGDANNLLFNNMQIAYGGFFRYVLDTRFALKAELNRTSVAGNYLNLSNQTVTFVNPVNTIDICGEFNFFDLEDNPYKRYSKTFSPYVFAGGGLMNFLYKTKQQFKLNYSFGIGLKVKLSNRWNLNAQWSNKLLLSDQLENDGFLNNHNNQNLNGSNILNNDLLSTLTIGVSYNIWKKECDCLNSNYGSGRKVRKSYK